MVIRALVSLLFPSVYLSVIDEYNSGLRMKGRGASMKLHEPPLSCCLTEPLATIPGEVQRVLAGDALREKRGTMKDLINRMETYGTINWNVHKTQFAHPSNFVHSPRSLSDERRSELF